MTEFLRKIGYVLSLSDAKFPESFHVTPFEGMASGSVTAALRWEGIEYLYPEEVIMDSLEEMAEYIRPAYKLPRMPMQRQRQPDRNLSGTIMIFPLYGNI